jgi:hypothetical protein
MATAFEMITEIYIRNRNSKAIHESLAHRRKLANDLKTIPNGSHLTLLTELEQEVALLEAALTRIGDADGGGSGQSPQFPPHNDSELVELERTEADADQHIPKAQIQTPPSLKQVEILVVDISKSTPDRSPAPAPQPAPHRTAPVQIVGLSISASSDAADVRAGPADVNSANDPSAS